MPTYTTVVGWLALIAVGAFFYYTWPAKPSGRRGRAGSKVVTRQFEAARAPKAKRSKKDGDQSSGDQSTDKKKMIKPPPEETWSVIASAPQSSDRDEDIDNREFARQLTSAKAGTLLPAKTKVGTKQRSVKQVRAQEKPVTAETSSDATAGGDADDDRSSFNSPELVATSVEVPVTNGGISDMLEAPPQTTPDPVETKKQRQNRKKAELKKAAREEDEKERKVLLEKQRRTAREAEGRAAKDGSAFMTAKTPASNAWTAPPESTNSNVTSAKGNTVELLDTFTPSASKTVAPEIHNSESEHAGSDWQKFASTLPSEEEQLRLAIEDSDNWETVQTKEKRKGKKAAQSAQSQSGEKKGTNSEKENSRPIVEQQEYIPTAPGKKWEMHLESSDEDGNVRQYVKVLQDSEWEVA
ncbi:hypothetical protein OIDMADRAFT_120728 [Oidiodendron maius Zn]|uniref:Uncharacterized protein n=1 Tax=Oidiodendron maius (strain Zn) TaxID=913774 RepID=A0A0C3H0S3_OIDMZ|nr:hypothetical protein OIDMADRAFT_120728 [Oidiodendron maius Zn]